MGKLAPQPLRRGMPVLKRTKATAFLHRGVPPLLVSFSLLGMWWLIVDVLDPPRYVLPPPAAVWSAWLEEWDVLLSNLALTARAALLGLALSAFIGIPLGFMIARWTWARVLLKPPVVAIQSIPKIALAPLIVVWFGFGFLPKVVLVVVVTIFPLILGVTVGTESIRLSTLQVAQTMGCKGLRLIRSVLLPASAPYLAGAFRVSASYALIAALIAEFIGSTEGIGIILLRAAGTFDTPLTFAAILVTAAAGGFFYLAATLLTRLLAVRLNPEYMKSVT